MLHVGRLKCINLDECTSNTGTCMPDGDAPVDKFYHAIVWLIAEFKKKSFCFLRAGKCHVETAIKCHETHMLSVRVMCITFHFMYNCFSFCSTVGAVPS